MALTNQVNTEYPDQAAHLRAQRIDRKLFTAHMAVSPLATQQAALDARRLLKAPERYKVKYERCKARRAARRPTAAGLSTQQVALPNDPEAVKARRRATNLRYRAKVAAKIRAANTAGTSSATQPVRSPLIAHSLSHAGTIQAEHVPGSVMPLQPAASPANQGLRVVQSPFTFTPSSFPPFHTSTMQPQHKIWRPVPLRATQQAAPYSDIVLNHPPGQPPTQHPDHPAKQHLITLDRPPARQHLDLNQHPT
jgi:hypothetical protein